MSFDLIDFKGIASDVPGTWVCLGIFRPTQISDPNNKIFFPEIKPQLFLQNFHSYMIAFMRVQFGAIIFRIVCLRGKFLKMSIFP